MRRLSVLLALAIFVASCDSLSRTPTAPVVTTPTPTPPTPTLPSPTTFLSDVTLSGMVYEQTANGRVPIADVWVYCEPCGAETHSGVWTDAKGFYTFTGVWTEASHFPIRIWIMKAGYTDPPGLPNPTPPNPSGPGWREVVVTGNTLFDAELVRQ